MTYTKNFSIFGGVLALLALMPIVAVAIKEQDYYNGILAGLLVVAVFVAVFFAWGGFLILCGISSFDLHRPTDCLENMCWFTLHSL